MMHKKATIYYSCILGTLIKIFIQGHKISSKKVSAGFSSSRKTTKKISVGHKSWEISTVIIRLLTAVSRKKS